MNITTSLVPATCMPAPARNVIAELDARDYGKPGRYLVDDNTYYVDEDYITWLVIGWERHEDRPSNLHIQRPVGHG